MKGKAKTSRWWKGQIVKNMNPDGMGKVWLCVKGGTPGKWKEIVVRCVTNKRKKAKAKTRIGRRPQ